jgi:hypothetical protein
VAVDTLSDQVFSYRINTKPMTETAFSLTSTESLCPSVNLLKILKPDCCAGVLSPTNDNPDATIRIQSILRMSIKFAQFATIKTKMNQYTVVSIQL